MKFCSVRKFYSFILLATLTALLSLTAACGSGGSVDTSFEANPPAYSWWEGYNTNEQGLVDAAVVAAWIDNDFKTESGSPVVVFDTMTDFTGTANRIYGSISKDVIGDFNINETRAEGPIDPTLLGHNSSSSNSIKGARVDAIIQDLGLTHDTVLVLAGNGGSQWAVWRFYWELVYWGFDKSKIKVLDGGVAALAAEDASLVDTTWPGYDPNDSTFSVRDLPKMKQSARVSMKQVIDAVKGGNVVIFSQSTADTGRIVATENSFFLGASQTNVNGLFNDADTLKATIIANMNASWAADGLTKTVSTWEEVTALLKGKKVIVHCVSGSSASALYMAFTEVLGIDVALYDGSRNQWYSYRAGAADSVDPAEVAFQAVLGEYNTTLYSIPANTVGLSDLIGSYDTDPRIVVKHPYTGTGNEIAEEDLEYFNTKSINSGNEGLQDGGASGGC